MYKKLTPLFFLVAVLLIGMIFLLSKQNSRFSSLSFKEPSTQQNHDGIPRFQLTQAIEVCKERIENTSNFSDSHYDSLSSRYDRARNAYLIFFRLKRKKRHIAKKSVMLMCRVSAANNNIQDFAVINPSL